MGEVTPELLQALEPEFTPQQLIDALDAVESLPPSSVQPDSLPLGACPVQYLTPEGLVERFPVAGDHAPPEPTLLSRPAPVDPQLEEWQESERIRERLDADPTLRGFVARYLASVHAITEENGGQPPSAFVLDPLWVDRLHKMSQAVGKSPNEYVETLLHRAWKNAEAQIWQEDCPGPWPADAMKPGEHSIEFGIPGARCKWCGKKNET